MINVKINADRAGRVEKPARSIEIIDPETGIKLGTISFARYGWGADDRIWAVNLHASSDLRVDLHLEKEHSPEIVAGVHQAGRGGFWRWDPTDKPEQKINNLVKTVERLTGSPIEVTRTETRLELDDPDWLEVQ